VTRKELGLKLRALLSSTPRSGTGRMYSAELRRAVVEFADAAVAQGQSQVSVARELGISAANVGRWLRSARCEGGQAKQMCRVELLDAGRRDEEMSRGRLVVHTTSGLSIEGLTLSELMALVRAVR